MGKFKKFFKILLFTLVALIFLVASLILGYWITRSDKEKADLLYTLATPLQGQRVSQVLFSKAISYDPANSKIYMEQSVPFNKRGDFTTGFRLLDRAVALDTLAHLGYRGWMHLRKLRNYGKALEDFQLLDSMTPGFVDAPWGENIYFLKGECLLGQKDYKGAIEQFDNYINSETDESWVDVYTFLYKGICLLKLGRSSKAEEQFEKMLTYYPQSPDAAYYQALARLEQGNIEICELLTFAKKNFDYQHADIYNEFLFEIYPADIQILTTEYCE